MAAAFKAINARIRSNPYTDYFCSTHFWGPASNFGIPLAAIMDIQKSPDIISGPTTAALMVYSGTFMRYAMAVTPANYLLFGCHVVNFTSQGVQLYRWSNAHYGSGAGNDKSVADTVKDAAKEAKETAKEAKETAKEAISGRK